MRFCEFLYNVLFECFLTYEMNSILCFFFFFLICFDRAMKMNNYLATTSNFNLKIEIILKAGMDMAQEEEEEEEDNSMVMRPVYLIIERQMHL